MSGNDEKERVRKRVNTIKQKTVKIRAKMDEQN